jgi:hypothetical protein
MKEFFRDFLSIVVPLFALLLFIDIWRIVRGWEDRRRASEWRPCGQDKDGRTIYFQHSTGRTTCDPPPAS